MFDKTHVWLALEHAQSILLGPYGMKTLDPRFVFSLLIPLLHCCALVITITWGIMSTMMILTISNVPVVSIITMVLNGCG